MPGDLYRHPAGGLEAQEDLPRQGCEDLVQVRRDARTSPIDVGLGGDGGLLHG